MKTRELRPAGRGQPADASGLEGLVRPAAYRLRAQWHDARGSCAVPVALMLTTLTLSIGAAVDVGRWHVARTAAASALEVALLAGARTLQVSSGDVDRATATAHTYFAGNLSHIGTALDAKVEFVSTADRAGLSARGSVWIKTTILALAGIARLPVLTVGEVARNQSLVTAGAGGSATEIALAVDVSGAMTDATLGSVKAGLRHFADIVLGVGASAENRIALVPFADTVTVPHELADAVRGRLRPGRCPKAGCLALQRPIAWGRDCAAQTEFGSSSGVSTCLGPIRRQGPCVTERIGADAVTDTPPLLALVGPAYPNASGRCTPSAPVHPLTTERATLNDTIAALAAGGRAAGHLGIAWAWYMLSPEWGYVWGDRAAADTYASLTRQLPSGAPALRKVVVLVTSGRFDVAHCDGIPSDAADGCPAPNGSSAEQTARLCDAMTARGIELFTVTAWSDGDSRAVSMLRERCARDRQHFHAIETETGMVQAMRDIALRISATVLH